MAAWRVLLIVPNADASAAWNIAKTALTKGDREVAARIGRLQNRTTKTRTHRAALLAVGSGQRDVFRTIINSVSTARLFVWDRGGILRFTDVNAAKQFENTAWGLEACLLAQNLERAQEPRPSGML